MVEIHEFDGPLDNFIKYADPTVDRTVLQQILWYNDSICEKLQTQEICII